MFVNIFVCLHIFSHYRKLKETRNKINDISALDVLHGKTCSFPAKPQLFTEIKIFNKVYIASLSSLHSVLKLEKSAISKVQKHIFYNFKNGKKSIFAQEKSLKLPKMQFLDVFLV